MLVVTRTFHWTEALSVNVKVLDEQHQKLIDTMNELDQALRTRQGDSAVDAVLYKMVNFASEHFATEEALMEKYDFPGLSTHRFQHEMFRKKIAQFLDDHKAGKAGVPVSLMLFMREWLKDHVSTTDKRYSAFLNARGIH